MEITNIDPNIFFTLDLDAKEIEENRFYVEEDAINEAQRAAKALKKKLFIFLWTKEPHLLKISGPPVQILPDTQYKPLHYALVEPSGSVSFLLQPVLAQAYYSLIARGLEKEAKELSALLESPSLNYKSKLPVFVDVEGGKQIDASVELHLAVDKSFIRMTAFKINGVADEALNDLIDPVSMTGESFKDISAQLEARAKNILQQFRDFPLVYDAEEAGKFQLVETK